MSEHDFKSKSKSYFRIFECRISSKIGSLSFPSKTRHEVNNYQVFIANLNFHKKDWICRYITVKHNSLVQSILENLIGFILFLKFFMNFWEQTEFGSDLSLFICSYCATYVFHCLKSKWNKILSQKIVEVAFLCGWKISFALSFYAAVILV